MKSLLYFFVKAALAIAIFIFASCGSETQDDNSPATQEAYSRPLNDSVKSTKDFFYSLPSPLLMAKVFKRVGLKYMEGVTNSPDNVSKYSTVQSKILNLGVYSADLAYLVLNKQNQQASKYMESINRLSDDVGMASVFDSNDYLNRFKNNLQNEDSLINVVCDLKGEMDMFMKDNNKEKQTLLIFIGAWTENMFIATQLTEVANKEKIATRVAEQKYILNSLINVSANFQSDEEFKKLFRKLNELKSLFDNLTVQGEDEKITMDQLQFKSITEKIRDLRKEIVG